MPKIYRQHKIFMLAPTQEQHVMIFDVCIKVDNLTIEGRIVRS